MYVFVCVFMYVYICMHASMHECMYLYMYVFMYVGPMYDVHMYVSMHESIHACMHVSTRRCYSKLRIGKSCLRANRPIVTVAGNPQHNVAYCRVPLCTVLTLMLPS